MRKIFLDTNFLMDYFVRPELATEAAEVLRLGSESGYRFAVSFLTIANFAYINRKMPKESRYKILLQIMEAFEIVGNSPQHLRDAIYMDYDDYEDALQYQTAISSGCQAIITRNVKDFTYSQIPIFTPQQFISFLKTTA